MRCLSVRLLVGLTVIGLSGESRALGDMVDFSYAWKIQPAPVIPSGTGNVTFSLEAGSGSAELGGTQPLVIPGATIQTSSTASVPPDKYNTNFQMTLHLTEGANSGDMTFKGSLAGTLTGTSSTLTVKFDSPVTQTLVLGGHLYTTTIGPLTVNVPSPNALFTAKIDGQVMVAKNTPPVKGTPEPSGLVLGATALVILAARRHARARRDCR
jgi:hypothetical protein